MTKEMTFRIRVQNKRQHLLEEKAEHWTETHSFPSDNGKVWVQHPDGSWTKHNTKEASFILAEDWRQYRAAN